MDKSIIRRINRALLDAGAPELTETQKQVLEHSEIGGLRPDEYVHIHLTHAELEKIHRQEPRPFPACYIIRDGD